MWDADRRRARRNKLLIYAGIVALVLLIRWVFVSRSARMVSPLPDSPVSAKQKGFTLFSKEKKPEDLRNKINGVIGDEWRDFSVVVEDFNSDFRIYVSEGEIFTAASVNKVPILAALYYYAGKGEIDLDRDITLQSVDIQDYGTGSIRYDPPGTVYSVKTLAKLMIKKSDNTAAYILSNHIIGFDKLKSAMQQWGLIQTDLVENKTSNGNMAKLFRMIYEGKITDPAHTQEMLSFLKDTDFETRLPAGVPKTASVYHKIGTEVNVIHDAGIVSDGALTYYLGIFTNGTTENPETDALIATISKTTYEFLKN